MSSSDIAPRTTPTRAAGRLPRAFWWLLASTLVNRTGTFVVPFLTLYLTQARGHTLAFAGLVVALVGVGGMAGSVLGGLAADRFGARRALIGAHLATAASTLALCLNDHLLPATALLVGMCSNAARPATSTLVIAVLPPKDRVRGFSLNYWAMNLGFTCSMLLAGLAATAGYPLLFLGDAATTLLGAAVVAVFIPNPPKTGPPPATAGTHRRTLLQDRPFLLFLLLSTAVAAVLQQMTVTLPVAMTRSGLSTTACGAVIALNGILITALQLPATRLVRQRRPFPLLALAATLIGAGFGATALADTTLAYAFTVAIWTGGEIISGPVTDTVTARFATTATHGRYQGANAFAWTLGGVIAAGQGGYLYDRYGPTTLWAGCATVMALAASGYLCLARRTPHHHLAVPEPAATVTTPDRQP